MKTRYKPFFENNYKIRDTVILKKGTTSGMGKLKNDTEGKVVQTDKDDEGNIIYGIKFNFNGRERITWIK